MVTPLYRPSTSGHPALTREVTAATVSDFRRHSHLWRIVDFNAETPHGRRHFGVLKEQLHRAEVHCSHDGRSCNMRRVTLTSLMQPPQRTSAITSSTRATWAPRLSSCRPSPGAMRQLSRGRSVSVRVLPSGNTPVTSSSPSITT